MRITQRSSGMTTTHALTSGTADVAVAAIARPAPLSSANGRPSAKPPPATVAEPTMNLRRERLVLPAGFRLHERPPRDSGFGASRSRSRRPCVAAAMRTAARMR